MYEHRIVESVLRIVAEGRHVYTSILLSRCSFIFPCFLRFLGRHTCQTICVFYQHLSRPKPQEGSATTGPSKNKIYRRSCLTQRIKTGHCRGGAGRRKDNRKKTGKVTNRNSKMNFKKGPATKTHKVTATANHMSPKLERTRSLQAPIKKP
jgi:hypothetical protein